MTWVAVGPIRACSEDERYASQAGVSNVGRGRARQLQDDAADGAFDMNAQLQAAVARPGRAAGRHPRCRDAQLLKLLHEHVGGGGQQDPKLVRSEPSATGAVDLQRLSSNSSIRHLDVSTRTIGCCG